MWQHGQERDWEGRKADGGATQCTGPCYCSEGFVLDAGIHCGVTVKFKAGNYMVICVALELTGLRGYSKCSFNGPLRSNEK